jgi:hypothetical protein
LRTRLSPSTSSLAAATTEFRARRRLAAAVPGAKETPRPRPAGLFLLPFSHMSLARFGVVYPALVLPSLPLTGSVLIVCNSRRNEVFTTGCLFLGACNQSMFFLAACMQCLLFLLRFKLFFEGRVTVVFDGTLRLRC